MIENSTHLLLDKRSIPLYAMKWFNRLHKYLFNALQTEYGQNLKPSQIRQLN